MVQDHSWFMFVVVILGCTTADGQGSCPRSWNLFKGKCYMVVPYPEQYTKAKEACISLNAQLGSITSKEENEFIFQIMPDGKGFVWMGLQWARTQRCVGCSLDFRRDNWRWEDGTVLNIDVPFQNWTEHSRSTSTITSTPTGRYRCGSLQVRYKYWQDAACGNDYPYVCEGNPHVVIAPSTPPTTESSKDQPTSQAPSTTLPPSTTWAHSTPLALPVFGGGGGGGSSVNGAAIAGGVLGALILLLLLLILLLMFLMRRRKRKKREARPEDPAPGASPSGLANTSSNAQENPYILDPATPTVEGAVGIVPLPLPLKGKGKDHYEKGFDDNDYDSDDDLSKMPKGYTDPALSHANVYEKVEHPSTSSGHGNGLAKAKAISGGPGMDGSEALYVNAGGVGAISKGKSGGVAGGKSKGKGVGKSSDKKRISSSGGRHNVGFDDNEATYMNVGGDRQARDRPSAGKSNGKGGKKSSDRSQAGSGGNDKASYVNVAGTGAKPKGNTGGKSNAKGGEKSSSQPRRATGKSGLMNGSVTEEVPPLPEKTRKKSMASS